MSDEGQAVSKVLVSGAVGVGKTTAVRVVSDVPVLTTEARPSDETRLRKDATTVAMDFGVLTLDGSRTVHLYGTPGQARFDFMWDILAGGSTGVIVLVDASAGRALGEMDPYLEAFSEMLADNRLALGVTRLTNGGGHDLESFRRHLGVAGRRVPVLEADPRSRLDMIGLIRALLAASGRGSAR